MRHSPAPVPSPRFAARLALLAAVSAASVSAARAADVWEATLERTAPAVVAMRVTFPRSFDTGPAGSSAATGFVVDAERGIILTNRHVVGAGPVVAEAIFLDHEEVRVRPIYRDPVHDFAFLRYDPADVRFMQPGQLDLVPEHARVGVEIRVIGNDAGEQLSILAGTLARLEREAPSYGRGRYNDFNTFYYQAASGTSGGSSGSPVIDRHGHVVSLNAGGRSRAASSFYLPLGRVVRALERIRAGEPVPRGTLQTVFTHRSYDELGRLGLRSETEAAVRRAFPKATGMLVVRETVPGGPGDGILEPGDVLVRLEGQLLAEFAPLEALLDDRVGAQVSLEIERGGAPVSVSLTVQDLHAITPAAYLEVGGAVLNPLSYQQARSYGVPVRGIYVAAPGYMFGRASIPRGAVVTDVGGAPTETLERFEDVVAALHDGQRVPVRYFQLRDPRNEAVAVVRVERRWFPMRHCVEEAATGRWSCHASPAPPPRPRLEPVTVRFDEMGDARAKRLTPSLAWVQFQVPYRLDGVHGDRFVGAGLVVDAERGLVVVDRDTVPIALGDVTLTFASALEVPGEVVALHPEHNLAIVSYDPAALGDTPVESAELRTEPIAPGDRLWLVGLTRGQQVVSQETRVSRVESLGLPLPRPPRFRPVNLEAIGVSPSTSTVGGVLADRGGRVLAYWASFAVDEGAETRSVTAGIPAEIVLEMLRPLREGRELTLRTLGAELRTVSLAEARNRGLPDAAAQRLAGRNGGRRRVLAVERLTAGTPASERLHAGDLLLAVGESPVTHFREVERAARAAWVDLTVLRDGRELRVRVPTTPRDGLGTRRALSWAGALLQAPHPAVAAQKGAPPEGVYVAWIAYGSPAHSYSLRTTHRITAVNGTPTEDLDAFLTAVADVPDGGSLRVKSVDLDGKTHMSTLKLDLEHWPGMELVLAPEGWVRREL